MSILGGIRSKLWNARRKLRDRRAVSRLVGENPWLGDVVRHMEHSTRMLTPRYLQYTNFVSNPGHALSLEACALVHSLCHVMQPRHVMDLGSGFSPYVFRSYQAEAQEEVKVRSVDDSPEWLQRTNDYLQEKGLSTDDLVTLGDLGPSDVGPTTSCYTTWAQWRPATNGCPWRCHSRDRSGASWSLTIATSRTLRLRSALRSAASGLTASISAV